MASHVCSSKVLTWEKLKSQILGRHRRNDYFFCGTCCKSFPTICTLHLHCIKHNESGSYFFDSVTNTAFPKYDSQCGISQVEEKDFDDDFPSSYTVLTGHAHDINDVKPEPHTELSKCMEDGSTLDQASHLKINNFHTATSTCSDSSEITGTNKNKDFISVSVKLLSQSEDGSIVCEVDAKDSHLFDATANIVLDQITQEDISLLETQHVSLKLPKSLLSMEKIDDKVWNKMDNIDKNASLQKGTTTFSVENSEDGFKQPDTISDVDNVADIKLKNNNMVVHKQSLDRDSVLKDKNTEECKWARSKKTKSLTDINNDTENTVSKSCVEQEDSVLEVPSMSGNKTDSNKHKTECILKDTSTYSARTTTRPVRNRKPTARFRESEYITEMNLQNMHQTDGRQCDNGKKTCEKNNKTRNKPMEEGTEVSDLEEELLDEIHNKKGNSRLRQSLRKQKEVKVSANESLLLSRSSGSEANEQSEGTDKSNCNTKVDKVDTPPKLPLLPGDKGSVDESSIRKESCNFGTVNRITSSPGIPSLNDNKMKSAAIDNVLNEKEAVKNHDDNCVVVNQEPSTSLMDIDDIEFDEEAESNDTINMTENKGKKERKKNSPRNGTKRFASSKGQKNEPLAKRKDLKCETCGKVGTIGMVRYHKLIHAGKPNYFCEICSKAFTNKPTLRSHMIRHGEKKWKCEYCPQAYFKKSYLETHMKKHTGENPFVFVCDLCGKGFQEKYILRRHLSNVHMRIRNFECDVCKEKFFRADTRDSHRARHFDPFLKCSYCNKMFKGELDKRKHELTHTGEKQFFCKLCNHGFSQLWPYYQHMWRIHNVGRDQAKEMRIKNPDLVFMRNVNKNPEGDQTETLNIPPGQKSVGNNQAVMNQVVVAKQLRKFVKMDNQDTMNLEVSDNLVFSEVDDSEMQSVVEGTGNLVEYTTDSLDLSNAIVLNMKEDTVDGAKETIVIQDINGDENYVMLEQDGTQTHDSSIIILNH